MSLNQPSFRWAGVYGAVLAISAGLLLFNYPVLTGNRLMNLSYDLPYFLRESKKPQEVVIVNLDQESHEQLRQERGAAWDRKLHGQLLRRLKQEGARLVVMDILFDQPGDEAATAELTRAMEEHGYVVIGSHAGEAELQSNLGTVATGFTLVEPIPPLADAALATALVETDSDSDYEVRRLLTGLGEDTGDFIASLSWKAADIMKAPITREHPRGRGDLWVNYYGGTGTIPNVSYYLLLTQTNSTEPGFFRDKVVFVGYKHNPVGFAGESKEDFRTPYTAWDPHKRFGTGVEVHATSFLNLLRGEWLVQASLELQYLILVCAGALFGVGLAACRPLAGAVLTIAGMGASGAAGYLSMWHLGTWFSWLIIPAVQIPIAYVSATVFNSLRLFAEKQRLEQSLAMHLSPARAQQILKQPELLAPGAEMIEVSMLFSDIANFTKITEQTEPKELFRLLNNYFETALGCIHETDGMVVKLSGDGIFAIWNAPLPQNDHQERACQAALRLHERVLEFDERHEGMPFRTRIGLHTGSAFVGNVGSSKRIDFTAIGGNVNLASRLEGLNKYLGTEVLATRHTQQAVEHTHLCRLAGHFRLKGLDRIVEVHELIGPKSSERAREAEAWLQSFNQAMAHFKRQEFDEAEAGFQCVLKIRPNDGPSGFYLGLLPELREFPPSKDWAGEIELMEK